MKNKDYCHLHIHTEYSQLDGMGTCEQYAKEAKRKGFKYLGITDHGNMDGLITFQQACQKHGIKPVLGSELYLYPEGQEKSKLRGHACLWVKNTTGFENLCKLLTFAGTEGFYYKPRVSFEYLLDHCEGLCISTACLLSFARVFNKEGLQLFDNLYDSIGDDLYCEIMPHKLDKQVRWNSKAIRLAKRYGLKTLLTNDCHYVKRRDYKAQEVLLAIQRKTTMNDPNRFKFSITGLHLKSLEEMIETTISNGHRYRKEFVTSTMEVAEKCSGYTIPRQEISLPRVPGVPINPNKAKDFLWDLCFKGYCDRVNSNINRKSRIPDKIYAKRLREEFNLTIKKKFQRYIFMVWELVDWCRSNGITIGPGRGSVGGSLIAYLLGITSVDPIVHNLLFSRFISEDRIDYPDIDIDFEDRKRKLVRKHLETIYGVDKIAGVSSFSRMKAKAVMKDVGRAFGVHWSETEQFTKLIEDNDDHTGIQDAIDNYSECQEYRRKYPKVVRFAKKLEGQVRGYGQHAAALVVSKEPVGTSGRCNLRTEKGMTLVNWEKENTEYVGLMKLDVLGLKLLSILSETKKLIKEEHDIDVDFERLDIHDKKVLKLISDGNTTGIFQLGTYAMTSLIMEMGIETFNHISDAVALVRPGPANSGMTEEYIKRKHGAKWKPMHRIYEKITEDTYGLLVYQEQVMQVISRMAGLPYSTADKIRKIIGKKRDVKEFEEYKDKFVRGCKKTGYFSESEALRFWDGLEKWAKYGFNRSHSVEYAMLAYWCAWLKCYYPVEFICASLTYGAENKKKEVVEDAYKLGLQVMLPKVGKSDAIHWEVLQGKLYIPFIEVKGIGKVKAVEATAGVRENQGDITKYFSKKRKAKPKKIGGEFGKLLDKIGAYDEDNPEMTGEIRKLFKFRITTNPRSEYKKLYKTFGNSLKLKDLDKVLTGEKRVLRKLVKGKNLIRKATYTHNRRLTKCERCDLRLECIAPVHPSPGKMNVAIVGEAPGPQEDEDRMGFVGRSGDMVWKSLRPYFRELFHVTNVSKCYPSKSRKPSAKEIATCSGYLQKELKEIKPALILSFGNTGLQFFRDQKAGIMAMSGQVLWNEYFGAWVVYCMHPAASLHNPESKIYYTTGMKRFKEMLRILGFPKK